MTPIQYSELSKYVAEEEKEENETASLEEEINFLREESTPTVSTNPTTKSDDSVESTPLEDDGDDLPF